MIHYGLQNANSSVIAVTGTATLLRALIDTAGSVTHVFPAGINGIDLFIEDGDVRILFDGNTPTASKGLLLKEGTVHHFRAVDFHSAKLIRTGSANVAVGVQVGFVDDSDEVTNSSGGGGSISAEYNATPPTVADGAQTPLQTDANGNLKATLATTIAGEDITNNVLKTEQRFSFSLVAADAAVKSGAGFLHALTFSCNDAAPTAGSIIVYDNTAESGTQIFNHTFTTTPFVPFTVFIDASFATGLYVGFTTTADVNVTVSYR